MLWLLSFTYWACVTAQGSSSVSSAPSPSPTTATVTPKGFTALDATTLSRVPQPSDQSVSVLTQAPNYSGVFSSYYSAVDSAQTTAEPQPVVVGPNGTVFSYNETDPYSIPTQDRVDMAYLPPSINSSLANSNAEILPAMFNISELSTTESRAIAENATQAIMSLINGSATDAASQCSTCKQALQIAQLAVQQVPWEGPTMATNLCKVYSFSKRPSCDILFLPSVEGAVATQIIYYANLSSTDAQYICNNQFKVCPKPIVSDYYPKISDLVSSPKPANASAPTPSGQTIKVLQLSDVHLDLRYEVGAEANCSYNLCCRSDAKNTGFGTTAANASSPAPRFGAFQCDSPLDLVVSAFQAIPQIAGLGSDGPAFTIYTGDSVAHDPINELDTLYVEATEATVYNLLTQFITGNGSSPIYPTISNHDNRYGSGWNAPLHLQPSYIQDLYMENYNFLATLWQKEGWLTSAEAEQARSHYTSYSAKTSYGLRIIGINGNTYYPSNVYNLVNTSNADAFGQFAFLAQELLAAEQAGERVWIIMHQELGFTGSDSMPNQADLMYQIVDRFSPHVIAGLFAGHTHETQHSIFYSNNATSMTADSAVAINFIGPSITPLTNLNSGFNLYEVDSATFDVQDAYLYFSNVSSFVNNEAPIWQFGTSYREAFGNNISWPTTSPLNATWWHLVTEQMEYNSGLIELYQIYQSKLSIQTTNVTSAVAQQAKICYMRSGSHALAQRCTPGYGSTQGS